MGSWLAGVLVSGGYGTRGTGKYYRKCNEQEKMYYIRRNKKIGYYFFSVYHFL